MTVSHTDNTVKSAQIKALSLSKFASYRSQKVLHFVASTLSLPRCRFHVVDSTLSLPRCHFLIVASTLSLLYRWVISKLSTKILIAVVLIYNVYSPLAISTFSLPRCRFHVVAFTCPQCWLKSRKIPDSDSVEAKTWKQ